MYWYTDDNQSCKALIRGDGKILTLVSCYPCEEPYTNFRAKVVDGYLKGIDATGLFEYK